MLLESSLQEMFKDTKGVIKIRKSKKDRQHNGQTTIYKTSLQYIVSELNSFIGTIPLFCFTQASKMLILTYNREKSITI
jgi:hypothetical protein